MKRYFALAAVITSLSFAYSVHAADLPIRTPAYKAPIAAPYNWTGFYAGLNFGGAWGTSNLTTSVAGGFGAPNQALVSSMDTLSLSPKGFTGGVQFGYNYQAGSIVYGVESDFDYFGLSSSSTGTFTFVGGGTFTLNNSVKTDWLFTLRPRIGLAMDRFLPYLTGGLAVTNIKYSSSLTDLVFGTSQASSIDVVRAGWTAGGGLEYAVASNWSIKGEYLYADFGAVSMNSIGGNGAVYNQSASLKASIVRGGINYRF